MPNKKKRVVLGVTGSIAAYRAADIASTLTKAGVDVDVVMTAEACHFITPLTFAALTHRQVTTNLWDEGHVGRASHIELADAADLVLVAPATAHLMAQYRMGLAPDALTAILLATPAPVQLAPAMNGKMWQHPATQENLKVLQSRGVGIIGPDAGMLACGYQGVGRMWPQEKVAETALDLLAHQ
jgi:phosphopantothenoylcysteine synthetase/decarboxylase